MKVIEMLKENQDVEFKESWRDEYKGKNIGVIL